MTFQILFTQKAKEQYCELEQNKTLHKQAKAIKKALRFLRQNPRHSSLNTHKYHTLFGPNNEDIFEAYAQNNTPGAYRIFWFYGPEKDSITIVAITKHP